MCDVEGAKALEMTRIGISCLPEEMLRRIFKLLTHKDLMNVLLVCRSWEMIGQDPALWTLFVVKVKTQGDIRKLEIPRLQKIQTITLEDDLQKPDVMRYLFQAMLAILSVTKIDRIWAYDLRSLEPRLCISVMTRLKILKCGSELTKEQLEYIFTAIAEGESKTEAIYINSYLNTHSISPHLFASAVTNVRELELFVIDPFDFQDEKFQAMLEMIKDDSRCLKKVRISMTDYNLASIEPEVLGSALNSLEDVVIEVVRRRVGHDWKDLVTDILQKLVRDDSKLKRLKLTFLTPRDIAALNPELVRQATEKVGKFW